MGQQFRDAVKFIRSLQKRVKMIFQLNQDIWLFSQSVWTTY